MARTPAAVQQADAEAKARLEFADAALALAGHEVTDTYLNDLARQQARGELTGDEARSLATDYLESR